MKSTDLFNHVLSLLASKGFTCWVPVVVLCVVGGSGCTDGEVATTPKTSVTAPQDPAAPAPRSTVVAEPNDASQVNTKPPDLDVAPQSMDPVLAAGQSGDLSPAAEPVEGNARKAGPEKDKVVDAPASDSPAAPADTATIRKIRQAMNALRSESAKIQIVGRTLSRTEQTRVKDLSTAIQHLETSLQALSPAIKKSDPDATEGVPANAELLLDELIESTDVSIAALQVVGRAMTDAELSRARTLLRVADGLRRAVGEIALETTGGRPQPDLLDLLPD